MAPDQLLGLMKMDNSIKVVIVIALAYVVVIALANSKYDPALDEIDWSKPTRANVNQADQHDAEVQPAN